MGKHSLVWDGQEAMDWNYGESIIYKVPKALYVVVQVVYSWRWGEVCTSQNSCNIVLHLLQICNIMRTYLEEGMPNSHEAAIEAKVVPTIVFT